MADFGGTDLDAFRAEARAWIEANFPAALKGKPNPMAVEERMSPNADQDAWRKAMGAKGWGVPTWPAAYGGGGLSPAEGRIVQQELNRAGAYNPIGGMGVMMFGPTLLEYGTEEQKEEHIPPIVRGEIAWCQGFSEPGAGSDLASLQTKAVDKGDHFEINGSKIWTSGAQWADWCFCLVRTDTSKKHEGISFVLFTMHQPGVEVRPIPLIAGSSPFCETFFTNARAEKKDLVGPLNGGWSIAKRLLQHERSGLTGAGGGLGSGGRSLEQLAKEYVGVDDQGRIADHDLRTRLVNNAINWRAFQQTAIRAMVEAKGNAGPSSATSIMKNAGTQLIQERHEMTLEIMGHQGLGWEGGDFTAEELAAVRGWLFGKAFTIFGGSQEVQSNIVSKRILGLPDLTQNH
ncbi:MAG TPA: acyl-CoA dehydrogenase family protein [Phenylobacterium sp.]|jgi:alkylation response protein AidB-like acyl-CoA dehydrogenase|uniref:acyl-CoA dehydrogenase family protein n=1 Tax=Phenylobacterium sp. TaxID=1871053 RepID=UPI002D45BA58|nr:acyl-CoA dehydrogenase family protein [Phenylobacterium sp.]HZZ66752.1 acyl-CoA dehydrogenase family protein [Phenylobacterium sp.]